MSTTEVFDNFSAVANDAALPSGYNNWNASNFSNFGVILDGTDHCLTNKAGNNAALTQLAIPAGSYGRIEAQFKATVASNSTPNNVCNFGFYTIPTPGTNNIYKRNVFVDTDGSISAYDSVMGKQILIAAGSVTLNSWYTFGISTDGQGKYTYYVIDSTGHLVASKTSTVVADAGIPLYAYVAFLGPQLAQDSAGWGIQFYFKNYIWRNDFTAYQTVSQRRPIRFAPTINGEDAYVTLPPAWSGSGKGIVLGHGYTAPATFESNNGMDFVNAGFAYGQSHTHGDSWGNSQAILDLENLRQWMVQYGGINQKVLMHGYSMGGLTAFNYAVQYPVNVDRIISESGVANMREAFPHYTSSIETAYGNITSYEAMPMSNDPIKNIAALVNIPISFWTGDQDYSIRPGQHTKQLSDRLAKLGGIVMYHNNTGKGHVNSFNTAVYNDFQNAYISTADPNDTKNLIQIPSVLTQTQIIPVSANSEYNLTTSAPNIISYLFDDDNGTYNAVTSSNAVISTKYRRGAIMLKLANGHNWSEVTLTRVR